MFITNNGVSSNSDQARWTQFVSNRRGISPGNLVFSTNKFDRHDITELLLKVALHTINPNVLAIAHCYQTAYIEHKYYTIEVQILINEKATYR